jgi:hypothetical protein
LKGQHLKQEHGVGADLHSIIPTLARTSLAYFFLCAEQAVMCPFDFNANEEVKYFKIFDSKVIIEIFKQD